MKPGLKEGEGRGDRGGRFRGVAEREGTAACHAHGHGVTTAGCSKDSGGGRGVET